MQSQEIHVWATKAKLNIQYLSWNPVSDVNTEKNEWKTGERSNYFSINCVFTNSILCVCVCICNRIHKPVCIYTKVI